MPDGPTPDPVIPDPKPDPTPDPKPDPKPDPTNEPDWKAEARKWEGRAKENSAAAARLKELEDAGKTETEKLRDELTAAQADGTTSKSELMRLRVSIRKGLTEAQAKRLQGTTEEELEADADELLSSFGGEKGKPAPKGRPTEKLRGGTNPDDAPDETDPGKLAEGVSRGW